MIEATNKKRYFELEKIQAKEISHTVIGLKPGEKNIELRVIVLELLETYEKKTKEKLFQYLLSDGTGSIMGNFFGEVGSQIREGDIIYMSGAYTTLYKGKMILYQGKINVTLKIGEYFFQWKEHPNVSILDWSSYEKRE